MRQFQYGYFSSLTSEIVFSSILIQFKITHDSISYSQSKLLPYIQQNQIDKYTQPMQPNPSPDARYSLMKRKPSTGPKRPTYTQLLNFEEHQQFDPKEYRMLVHCFANNLSMYYNKKHKNLLGELEDLYKIPLNKQQKHFLQQNLQTILDRNIGKLGRDMLARNTTIYKNINQYMQLYHKHNNKFQDFTNINAPANANLPTNSNNIQFIIQQNKPSHSFSDINQKWLIKVNNQQDLQGENQGKQRQKQELSSKQGRKRPLSGYNRPIHSHNYGYYNKKSVEKGGSESGVIFKNKDKQRDNYLSLNGQNFSNNWNTSLNGFTNIITSNCSQPNNNGMAAQNQQVGQVFIRQNFRKIGKRIKHNSNNYTSTSNHNKNHKIINQQFLLPLTQQNTNKYREDQQFITIRVGDENSMIENNMFSQHNIGNQSAKDVSLSLRKNKSREFYNSRSVNINGKNNRFFYEKYHLSNNFNNIPVSSNTSNLTPNIGYNLNLNNFSNRPKSIDEMEKQRWQTKILSMNGVLSANITKPQGYKPKSKCWGTTVVASGKIVDKVGPSKSTITQPGKILFSMMRYKS